jgi:hypothetical protein
MGTAKENPKLVIDCECEAQVLLGIHTESDANQLSLDIAEKSLFFDQATTGAVLVDLYTRNLTKKCCEVGYQIIILELDLPEIEQFFEQVKRLRFNSDTSIRNGNHIPILALKVPYKTG